ncbi:hypothetical protein BJ875DRAFT_271714 [Amylocarpus encephaloides]|uniref:Uncharacterized protein n=1 Tax=Amylocarpus encephaloides TaxID=45428 RepID=A0A9P7Y698_9HELO|nr:hypothetical protein BJ875DRAFT_271714 [Amylocarpus encephaloides]
MDIAAFALQLAWIFAAFRRPLETLALSAPEMQHIVSDSAEVQHMFALNLQSLKKAPDAQTSARCWNPFFRSLVIASGFPIPERPPRIRGVELSIPLMMRLAQLEYYLPYFESFVLKGRIAAAVPEYEDSPGDERCIQWHIIHNDDNSDLGMESFHNEVTVLESNRHFLGLYSDSRIHLGTAVSNTQALKSAPDGELYNLPRHIVWSRSVNVSASLGVSHAGAGVSSPWQFSKDTLTSTNPGPIKTQVSDACQNLSVLYETDRKVGWMVPEICVIFHLMRRHMQDRGTFGEDEYPAFQKVKDEELADKSLQYVERSDTIKELFKSFGSRFRQMKELIYVRSNEGFTLSFLSFLSFHLFTETDSLCGVDFVTLSNLPEQWSVKRVNINKEDSGGWAKVIKAQWKEGKQGDKQRQVILAFFCKTLDPKPICHETSVGLCGTWQPIPSGKSYLVTTYGCIESLSSRHGAQQLSPDHYWRKSSIEPFQCTSPDCNRLQKTQPKFEQGDWELSSHDSALVFGGRFTHMGAECPLLQ